MNFTTLDRIEYLPELRANDALGRNADDKLVSLEFQGGTSLVWFRFGASSNEHEAVIAGNKLLALAHATVGHAMKLAEEESRRAVPDFWTEFDNTTAKGNVLSVWGARLEIARGEIEYDVSENHYLFQASPMTYSVLDVYEEDPIRLPDFPEGHHIYVVRAQDGSWSVHSSPR